MFDRAVRLSAKRLRPLCLAVLSTLLVAPDLFASDTPNPTSVTVAGSLQSELGCSGDWQPDCAATHLVFDAQDDVWQGTFSVPAGDYEYKAPVNDSWSENYGLNAVRDGGNIPLSLGGTTAVKFYYSHETHWITSNSNSIIAIAPGSFQSELGCENDWDPSCLRSWLQDPDGDGIFTFRTRALPAGSYEAKVALNETWDINYGDGGVQNGGNIAFSVPGDCVEMQFSWNGTSKVLSIGLAPAAAQPGSVTVAGSLQSELGCSGDWQPDCAATHLSFDASDGVWQQSFSLPAGSYEYKAPLNDSWDVNYGLNAQFNGPNIPLNPPLAANVKFYYDHRTHWITSNANATIAVAPGSFQSELGCPGDWDPSCLRSWLQDPDGDGFFNFSAWLPAGSYEAKVAIDESWDENYGDGGAPNGANIPFSVPRSCTQVFFGYDAVTHILTAGAQNAPRGNIKVAKAHWLARDTIAWNAAVQAGQTYRLHYSPDGSLALGNDGITGGSAIALTPDPAGIGPALAAKFPHLAGFSAFKISAADLNQVATALKGQLAVSATAADASLIDATALQIPGVLDDLYVYNGALGVTFAGNAPTLRVWAPTAQSVALLLFNDSNPATTPTRIPMIENSTTGVWSLAGTSAWNRKFYLYEVEVFVRSSGAVETNRVSDPYSFSLSTDSLRSQIVNLADSDLRPPGWNGVEKPKFTALGDATLYELHVRDFSITDTSVSAAKRGTFRAFGEPNSNGMRHLRKLAEAGLSHVHLLPSFDFATVRENPADRSEPAGDLASFPSDSDQQQAAVAAVKDQDSFNWGYDPLHYTVPEGSYSTNPDGTARIAEFREMVQGLNRAGLRVVMDVVYNHTNAAGQNAKAVLDGIVPGYYHRLNGNGEPETSSCCPNTASEHRMMEKLMVDSLVVWARDYKVDGFRFDLMGHHSKANLLKVRAALDALRPNRDGVDGAKILLYGEGWNFGEVANNARFVQATQANMAGTGIGTFNDRLRDAARGGGPFSGIQEQGFLTGLFVDPNATDQGNPLAQMARLLYTSDWIRAGLAGSLAGYSFENAAGATGPASGIDYNGQPTGYTAAPRESINYIEAHDNDTLWDAIQLKASGGASVTERARMQNLGIALVGLGQGIPFFHAGADLLRSKSLDRDSFNSGDWFNKLDWTYTSNNWGVGLPSAEKNQSNWPVMQPLLANPALKATPANIQTAVRQLREVLEIRKSSDLFHLPTAADVAARLRFWNTGPSQVPGVIAMTLSDPDRAFDKKNRRIVVIWNAQPNAIDLADASLVGLKLKLHKVQKSSYDATVRTSTFTPATGSFRIPGRTAAVFVEKRAGEEDDD